jgi:hypothetical protein
MPPSPTSALSSPHPGGEPRRSARHNRGVTSHAVTPLWSDNPTANDLLGFADINAPILDAVRREKLDPVTVGIFGDWGSGKTTLLELLQDELGVDARVVVRFTRPWEYDPATDPKATLIAEVLGAVHAAAAEREGGVDKLSRDLRDRFKSLARRVKWSKAITLAANSALSMGLPKIEDVMGLFGEDEETAADRLVAHTTVRAPQAPQLALDHAAIGAEVEVTPALHAPPMDAAAQLAAARAHTPPAPQPNGHDHPLRAERDVDDRRAWQAQQPVECVVTRTSPSLRAA